MLNKYQLLQKVKTKNLLIDTGPLSLLLVGLYNVKRLDKFSINSKRFDKKDFTLLIQFVQEHTLFVTPQILAETVNITSKYIEKNEFSEFMKINMTFLKDRLTEIYIKKNEILENDLVLRFGITDISVFLSSKDKAILTLDWALRGLCEQNKVPAYHLNEITSAKWLIG